MKLTHYININHMVALCMTVFLVSCSPETMHPLDYSITKGKHGMFTPHPAFLELPQGDDSYSQGFRDGCNTFLGSVSEAGVRGHSFAYDVNRGIEDRDYYIGYRIASDICTYFSDVDPL